MNHDRRDPTHRAADCIVVVLFFLALAVACLGYLLFRSTGGHPLREAGRLLDALF